MNFVARTALVALLAAPTVAHGLHRGGESAWVLAALFLAPVILGRRDPVRAILIGGVGAFLVPLLPLFLHVLPFAAERTLLHGTFAALALGGGSGAAGENRWRRARGDLVVWLRWTVGLGAAWSVAAAARGVVVALPEGAPWVGEMLAVGFRDLLVDRSQVEAVHPIKVACLRLEYLAFLWLSVEVGAGRADFIPRLVRALAWSTVAAIAITFADIILAAHYRGEDVLARLRARFPRNHRPLLDNNALGTAMVAVLPVVIGGAAGQLIGRRSGLAAPLGRAAIALAIPAGLFLLATSRSKAALGAFALALPLAFLLGFGLRRALRTWWIAGPIAAGVLAVAGAQLAPVETLHRLGQNRYLADAIRVVRLDAATSYLRANRSAPWSAAWQMGWEAPLTGQGLGRMPARMADFRDPDRKVQFNPRHENAHNQVLHSFGEEGAAGVVLLLVPFVLATLGARCRLKRRRRGTRGEDPDPQAPDARQWPILVGLAVVPAALFVNLQVGHSLLENSVAYLVALIFGAAIAQGVKLAESPTAPRAIAPRAWSLGALVGLVGFAPAVWSERPALEDFAFGCFPWTEWPQGPPDRLLGYDARWLQTWGNGPRMKVRLRDGRPNLEREPLDIDVWIDGELVIEDWNPPRPSPTATQMPTGLLRVDAPPGVVEGDLVEVRLVASPIYATTLHYDTGRPWIGPRMGTPFFRLLEASADGE